MLWARAMSGMLADRQAIDDVLMQRNRHPSKVSDKDFFKECAWAIFVAGFKVKTVRKIWPELEKVFFHWDYERVCQNKEKVRAAATRVINRTDKAEAVISIAQWICKTGWPAIREQLVNGLRKDACGNFVPPCELMAYLDQQPMIGETSAIFILKNLGYDVAKPDVLLRRLATKFDYPGDKDGVQCFTSDISKLVLERISVVEAVLWNASSSGADLSFKCPACGRQR